MPKFYVKQSLLICRLHLGPLRYQTGVMHCLGRAEMRTVEGTLCVNEVNVAVLRCAH